MPKMKVKQLAKESFLIPAILVLSFIALSTLKFISMDDERFVHLKKLIQFNMAMRNVSMPNFGVLPSADMEWCIFKIQDI